MVDAREDIVLQQLADLHTLPNYLLDRMQSVGDAERYGEAFDVPSVPNLEVRADANARVNDLSTITTVTPDEITLTVDQKPWIQQLIPAIDRAQILRGNWMPGLGRSALTQLRNYADGLLLDDYLAGQVVFDAAGGFTFNAASDSLTAADLLVARGTALRNKGANLAAHRWIFDPLAQSGLMGLQGWRPNESRTEFGASDVATLYGITMVETPAVQIGRVFTPTAASVSGGELILTFAGVNPGIVVGSQIQAVGAFAGGAGSEIVAGATVSAVSANGLEVRIATAAGPSGDVLGSGTVRHNAAINMLVDTDHVYRALQRMPASRIKPDPGGTGDFLEVSMIFGMLGRQGRAWGIQSPHDSI